MVAPAGSDGEERSMVRGETRIAPRGSPSGDPPATRGMKVALFGGASVFTIGMLVQVMAVVGVALAATITTLSGTILVHTGGLEPKTFATCVTAAIVVDVVLVIAIVGAWLTRLARRELSMPPGGYYVRYPVRTTAAGLLAALLVVTLAGWKRSVYFPYPLATIVVLANAYFFTVVGVLGLGRLADKIWRPLRSWAESSSYRTGFLTATLLLLGTTGFILRGAHWYEGPARQINAELQLGRARAATGFADAQLKALCIAAEATAPQLAHDESASGCEFLTGDMNASGGGGASGGGTASDCFTSLSRNMQDAKQTIRRRYRLNFFDADDVVMHAIVATCTRDPLPDDLDAYFWRVAHNRGLRLVDAARRTMPCESPGDEVVTPTCSSELPEVRAVLLGRLWETALCELDERAAQVLRGRLIDGLSFRSAGERLGLDENSAKNLFHNTLRKLRRRLEQCSLDPQ